MRTFSLEIRGPVPPEAGGTEGYPFEWRIVDIESREVVFSGASPSEELALQEARAAAEQERYRSLISPPTVDASAQVDPATETPGRMRGLAHSLKEELAGLSETVTRKPAEQPHPPASVPPVAAKTAAKTQPTPKAAPKPAAPHRAPKPSGARQPPPKPAPAKARAPWRIMGHAAPSPPAPPSGPMALVHSLLTGVDSLPSTEQVAIDLLDQVTAEVAADGAAVLLRGSDGWQVAAGKGLRPLEFRCVLTSDHWLVGNVYRDGDPLLLESTDTVRAQLTGAPLASRRSLIVVPLAGANALLLLARQDEPAFTREDLDRVAKLSQATVPVLTEAVDVRELARGLARYRDLFPWVAPPTGQ